MWVGHFNQSALHGVLAQVEALGLELLEVHKLMPTRDRERPAPTRAPLREGSPIPPAD
jgi:hypothetical protein